MALQNATKIAIGWAIATGAGVYTFMLARQSVNEKRYRIMKEKQHLRESNLVN